MDFIEQVFGLSPDGGSGWFEFLLFAIPLAGIAWLWRRRIKRQRRDDDAEQRDRR
jgi:membrane protein implicated in regulation of membrane protease activity